VAAANRMTRRPIALALLLAATIFPAVANAANCEADRQLYPKNWNAAVNETPLFTCSGRYIHLRVFLTRRRNESTLLLTVVNDKNVYRAILDPREADRFKQQTGLYILYSEKTCFIRGNYSSPAVLSFGDGSMSNAFNFLFAANSLDEFDGCEPVN
jgi:hypothetical protein